MSPARLLYITSKDSNEAKEIIKSLLSDRLIACANILPTSQSMYWWQGQIEESHEVVVIAKTLEPLVPQAIARVKHLHSYECPCVLSLPITTADQPFLQWLQAETSTSS